jgi:MFS superfamily sulfate permease-like transporter
LPSEYGVKFLVWAVCGVEREKADWCSILPALAFSLDMFEKTKQSYGVNEVLLASVLGAVVFSVFAAQPLVIVGVTGGFVQILAFSCQDAHLSKPRSDYGL